MQSGTLYVVATPIGNLQDITFRAVDVLKKVDRIAAEDTRHAALLLNHFSIQKPILSLHEHNERERSQMFLDWLQQGESVALISDAGTPLISDPGFDLVRKAKALALPVVALPGPCAAIAALSVSGLPTNRFVFEGFLPPKEEACKNYLSKFIHETGTMVFYEAPQRLLTTLNLMAKVFGAQRIAVIARELTKIHESVLMDELKNLTDHFVAHPEQQRGEIVIIVSGVNEESQETKEVVPDQVLDILLEEIPLKQASALASKITGVRKNILYERALAKTGKK